MDTLIQILADGTLLLILLISAPIVLWSLHGRFWSSVPVLVMAGLTSLLAGKIMSLLYQPEVARPFLEHGAEAGAAYIDNPGFPSDHALLGMVAIVAVYALTRNKRLAGVLLVIFTLMAIGRVAALVHTPLDVIGGAIAGLLGAFWYYKLTKPSKRSNI